MTHDLSQPTMVTSGKTAREIFEEVRSNPARARFGFGEKLAIVNVDPQPSYTRPDLYPKTAYITEPRQMEHIDAISSAARAKGLPVVWTHVAYMTNAADAGVWVRRAESSCLELDKHKLLSCRHSRDLRADEEWPTLVHVAQAQPVAVDLCATKTEPELCFARCSEVEEVAALFNDDLLPVFGQRVAKKILDQPDPV